MGEAQRTLAEREEAVAAQLEGLAAARKRMPMTRVEGDYRFEGPGGELSPVDLLEGRSQLILYRFFFEEGVAGWPEEEWSFWFRRHDEFDEPAPSAR